MSQPSPQRKELEELEKAFSSETRAVNIRLREGEYQLGLAKAVASSELELRFPDVKDLVRKLFGEKKTEDLQFVSKIQTILKKMEKSGVIKILTKEKPWELQRYALSSFKFQDVEKNLVILATDSEINKTRNLIHTQPSLKSTSGPRPNLMTSWILLLVFVVIGSYAAIIWDLSQPTTNLIIFSLAFCIAAACSIFLATLISKKKTTNRIDKCPNASERELASGLGAGARLSNKQRQTQHALTPIVFLPRRFECSKQGTS